MFGKLFQKKLREYPAPVDQLHGEIWVIQGARLGEKWSLDEGEITIGRLMSESEVAAAQGRAVSFPDHCKFISGHHAAFRKQADGYWVHDLGSKNGTTLNGDRIEKARLMDGDEVDVGQVVFKVKVQAPEGAQPQRACLITIVDGARKGEAWNLDGELLVGRELQGDHVISFPDDARDISTEHAVFKRVKHGFWVYDKGSKNGTFVNGERVERAELKDGDRILIGGVTFEARVT